MDLAELPSAVIDLLSPFLVEGGAALKDGTASRDIADLEISLHRRGANYTVETRYTPPGSSAEIRLGADGPLEITLDQVALNGYAIEGDWYGYGRALSQSLFQSEALKIAFAQALARVGNGALQLRLLFGPTAQELHRLYWETLRNPLDGSLLTANQNVYFSRYLASAGGKDVLLRPKSLLRALVLVANPIDLGDYGLERVEVDGEIQRASKNLKGVQMTSLPAGKDHRASFTEMVRRLQSGCDILYIVAHGAVVKNQAWLWLEDDFGRTHRVSGADLAAQINSLEKPPLLVVLASCESAGNGEGDARLALGPLICSAGVPAVIAMQGRFSMQSAMRGMPVFFERLIEDCRVDRALAAMRAALSAGGATDLWMPALFLRLKDGSICQLAEAPAPPALRKLWSLIQIQFQGKAAAEAAIEDLLWDATDVDNRAAFGIQLKKALRDDQDFANQLLADVEGYLQASGKDTPGGISINVGGNVGGGIVIGNNNTVSS